MSDNTPDPSVAVETEAKALGWVPLDQWRGPESAWSDAAAFVERGHQVVPILRANNRELVAKLTQAQSKLDELNATVAAQGETVKNLVTFQAEEVKRQVTSQVAQLKLQKREAIKAGDHDLAADIEGQIDEAKETAPKPTPAAPPPPAPKPTEALPEWAQSFALENPWMGKDKRKTGTFTGICAELHETQGLVGRALLDAGLVEMEKDSRPTGASKSAEGGRGGAGNGASTSGNGMKGYAALDSDAKRICDSEESKFVGPNKLYKTQKEWRDYYSSIVLGA